MVRKKHTLRLVERTTGKGAKYKILMNKRIISRHRKKSTALKKFRTISKRTFE